MVDKVHVMNIQEEKTGSIYQLPPPPPDVASHALAAARGT